MSLDASERKSQKFKNNGLLYRFLWHLSYLLTPLFVRLKISPNMISWFSLAFYLMSGWFFLKGEIFNNVIAAVMFFLGVLMDCTDGKVARVIGQSSFLGVWLDANFDYLKPVLIYLPIAIADYNMNGEVQVFVYCAIAMQFYLLFHLLAIKWQTFTFSELTRSEIAKKGGIHLLLREIYFIEGVEVLIVLIFSIGLRMGDFLKFWALYVICCYLGATLIYGQQLWRRDQVEKSNTK